MQENIANEAAGANKKATKFLNLLNFPLKIIMLSRYLMLTKLNFSEACTYIYVRRKCNLRFKFAKDALFFCGNANDCKNVNHFFTNSQMC